MNWLTPLLVGASHSPNHHVVGWIVAIVAAAIVVGIILFVRFRHTEH
jgi:hypothetical protein